MSAGAPTIIALCGHPVAQDAAHLQLQALITQRRLPMRVLAGVTKVEEARAVLAEGGELWQCGTEEPRAELAPLIDRTLPASTFEAMALHVAGALASACGKPAALTTTPAQEPAHG